MQKIKLDLDHLAVESFETAGQPEGRGTVQGHATNGQACASAVDACPSGRGCTVIGCDTNTCDTYDPDLCPSVVDACPSARGCTEIGC